jgi:RNA polymerase-binding protein DksA
MPGHDQELYRQRLLDERRRVTAAIEYLHLENAGSMEDEGEEAGVGNHLAETASATLDREIDYSLEENSAHMLAAIDAALERIESGSFGTCTNCGKPIDEGRLEAIPYTTVCIDCRRREEQG